MFKKILIANRVDSAAGAAGAAAQGDFAAAKSAGARMPSTRSVRGD
ncbi:MAG: hypothetical protein JNL87_17535 [Burkholderiaceae bacterium]|nr:hypothetical protein [Burkholderiaceae bacterium]